VRGCLLTPESGVVSEEPDTINRPGRVPEGDGRVQEGWRQLPDGSRSGASAVDEILSRARGTLVS
jgi:hypothetical protein